MNGDTKCSKRKNHTEDSECRQTIRMGMGGLSMLQNRNVWLCLKNTWQNKHQKIMAAKNCSLLIAVNTLNGAPARRLTRKHKMTYANITIGDLLDTYMYADRPDNFEGIICDADSQAVVVIFNS